MSAVAIFPLAQWLAGTNQNSTAANDNTLRMEACFGPALGLITTLPTGTPADHDQYVVKTPFLSYAAGNILVYLGGTWKEFSSYNGLVKSIAGVQYVCYGGVWTATPVWSTVPTTSVAAGVAGQIAFDAASFYVCIDTDTWTQAPLTTF